MSKFKLIDHLEELDLFVSVGGTNVAIFSYFGKKFSR